MSLFLDGLEEDGTPFDTQPLAARLSDISEDGAMWVGLGSNGKDAFCFMYYKLPFLDPDSPDAQCSDSSVVHKNISQTCVKQ